MSLPLEVSSPLPGIITSSTPRPSQCANELQMFQRNSNVFRSNVAFNATFEVATLVCSLWVYFLLRKRSFFSKSFTFLLYASLIVANLHQWNYGYIQIWSLVRALIFFDQPCSIMFTEFECFQWYTNSIFSRLLLLFMSCALTGDNILTFAFPRFNGYTNGIIFLLLAILASVGLCAHMTADGPNNNIQSNCFQRLGRDINELKTQINMYLIGVSICCLLNAGLWILKWRAAKKRVDFDLNKRNDQKESINTAGATSVIVMAQMVCSAAYTWSVTYLINNGKDFDPRYLGIYVLWCYTYTLSAFFLPVGILIFTKIIHHRRRKQVQAMTKEGEDIQKVTNDHFMRLDKDWDKAFGAKTTAAVPALVEA